MRQAHTESACLSARVYLVLHVHILTLSLLLRQSAARPKFAYVSGVLLFSVFFSISIILSSRFDLFNLPAPRPRQTRNILLTRSGRGAAQFFNFRNLHSHLSGPPKYTIEEMGEEERWAISWRTMLVNYPKFYLTNSSVKRRGRERGVGSRRRWASFGSPPRRAEELLAA